MVGLIFSKNEFDSIGKLLSNNPLDKITIVELAKTFKMSTTKFYTTYTSKESLFIDYLYALKTKIIDQYTSEVTHEKLEELLVYLLLDKNIQTMVDIFNRHYSFDMKINRFVKSVETWLSDYIEVCISNHICESEQDAKLLARIYLCALKGISSERPFFLKNEECCLSLVSYLSKMAL
ncbi:hypothetical protein [uncultured Tolumonas sp.]|uniref:hypothetical protein n=1 Tax=uncultured Tolumonas sp. TaxID=263765 RepID=UPI002930AD5C|nr:hypothetical protein [uncultured Tolumonas sp.]